MPKTTLPKPVWACSVCGKRYVRPTAARNHVWWDHTPRARMIRVPG